MTGRAPAAAVDRGWIVRFGLFYLGVNLGWPDPTQLPLAEQVAAWDGAHKEDRLAAVMMAGELTAIVVIPLAGWMSDRTRGSRGLDRRPRRRRRDDAGTHGRLCCAGGRAGVSVRDARHHDEHGGPVHALAPVRGGGVASSVGVRRASCRRPRPGVVMVMEVFGVNDDMRAHAERIASWGYVVVVPDLYSDGGAWRCLAATMRALATGRGRAFADIERSRQWLLVDPQTTDDVGIVGFCMGGGFALLACDRSRYRVASANYGRVPEDLTRSCPVVGSYGARDRQNPGAAEKLAARLDAADVEHDVREYADSGHAFLNDSMPGPAALAPLWHVAGFGGSRADAEDAWRRTEAYLAAHL